MSTIGISATTGIRIMPSPGPASSPGAIVGVAKMASVIGEKNTHRNANACGSHLCRLSIRAMKYSRNGYEDVQNKHKRKCKEFRQDCRVMWIVLHQVSQRLLSIGCKPGRGLSCIYQLPGSAV